MLKKSGKVKAGDVLEVRLVINDELELEPEPMELAILYEDEHIVVINKPAGLVVHPAPGNWHGTLVNGLVHHFGDAFSTAASGSSGARGWRPCCPRSCTWSSAT